MMALRCSSKLLLERLVRNAPPSLGIALFLSPQAFYRLTWAEIAHSFYLARSAFKGKRNVSGKLSNEALLFLACEMNFSSALKKLGARDPMDFVLVCERALPRGKLMLRLGLDVAERASIPRLGKMKGRYLESELAIERMALGRARN